MPGNISIRGATRNRRGTCQSPSSGKPSRWTTANNYEPIYEGQQDDGNIQVQRTAGCAEHKRTRKERTISTCQYDQREHSYTYNIRRTYALLGVLFPQRSTWWLKVGKGMRDSSGRRREEMVMVEEEGASTLYNVSNQTNKNIISYPAVGVWSQ